MVYGSWNKLKGQFKAYNSLHKVIQGGEAYGKATSQLSSYLLLMITTLEVKQLRKTTQAIKYVQDG